MGRLKKDELEGFLKDYTKLRKKLIGLHSILVERLDPSDLDEAAVALDLLDGGELRIEAEEEITVLMDHCLYSSRHEGKTIFEAYRESQKLALGSHGQRLLDAMADSRFSVYRFDRIHRGIGGEVTDLLYGDRRLLLDVALSHSITKGGLLLSRTLDMGNWIMTTGAALPFDRDILELAKREFSDGFDPKGLLITPTTERLLELEQFLLWAAFEAGCSLEVGYK